MDRSLGCAVAIAESTEYYNTGHTRSCGCLQRETAAASKRTHGHSRQFGSPTPEYQSWCHALQRCHNPKNGAYKNYGARGIIVCRTWRKSFTAFLRDVGPRPGPGYTIDRIDNNGGYFPSNVRWATKLEQVHNSRVVKPRRAFGRIQCLSSWVLEFGVKRSTVEGRLRRGMTLEAALTDPLR